MRSDGLGSRSSNSGEEQIIIDLISEFACQIKEITRRVNDHSPARVESESGQECTERRAREERQVSPVCDDSPLPGHVKKVVDMKLAEHEILK